MSDLECEAGEVDCWNKMEIKSKLLTISSQIFESEFVFKGSALKLFKNIGPLSKTCNRCRLCVSMLLNLDVST